MAATLTITLDDTANQDLGFLRGAPSGRVREVIKIVGNASAAGDTGTYTPAYAHADCTIPDGDFYISSETDTVAGASLTITAVSALGSNTVRSEVEGRF